MLQQLQQREPRLQMVGLKAVYAVGSIRLIANKTLLLVLALVIIPTLSGVTLIA